MFAPSAVSTLTNIENCTQKYTVGELIRSYSGYRIDWRLFFSILLDRNISDNLEICYSDISYDVTDILYETQINTIKNFIKFHIILNSDIMFAHRILIHPFSGGNVNSLNRNSKEESCLDCLQNVLPISSIFHSEDDTFFNNNASIAFSELKKSLIKIIDNMYWIPFKQRRALIAHANEAGILYTTESKYGIYSDYVYSLLLNNTDFFPIVFGAIRQKYQYQMDGHIITPLFINTISYYNDWMQYIGKHVTVGYMLNYSTSVSSKILYSRVLSCIRVHFVPDEI